MTPNRLLLKFASTQKKLVLTTIVLGFTGAVFNGISTALVVPVVLSFLGREVSYRGLPSILQNILSLPAGLPENQRFWLS
jgi:ATP-binding cassette, subfamily B, bacterial MsbA